MPQPEVAIIIPVRNEAANIQACLEGVWQQDYPRDRIAVMVVDGMSSDSTREIAAEFAAGHPDLRLQVLDNPKKIVPCGLNIALRRAEGEIIIRVDGHCLIPPDYVRCCVQHLQQDGVDGVGGPITTHGETKTARAIAIGMSTPFGVGNSAFRTTANQTRLADTVPFPAYTRRIIERAGLYDEELVRDQDDEYSYRIRELGGKLLLAEDVHSLYFSRTSLLGLWKQYYQYGYWKVRVLQKHPRQMSLRQFVPPVFLLSLIVTGISAAFWRPAGRLFLAIAAAYLAANLIASLSSARKQGWEYLLPLLWIYPSLHLSYGAGFLCGFLKFWNRWGDKKGCVPGWQKPDSIQAAL